MSSTDLTARRKAAGLLGGMAALAVVIGVGLLLRQHGPGNMGTGFLVGAGVALAGAAVMGWRVLRSPAHATTFERAFLQQGDEREDAVLTRAFAVLGLLAAPLTGVAAVAIGLGAEAAPILFGLLVVQVLVGAGAFVAYSQRM